MSVALKLLAMSGQKKIVLQCDLIDCCPFWHLNLVTLPSLCVSVIDLGSLDSHFLESISENPQYTLDFEIAWPLHLDMKKTLLLY